MPSLPGPDFRLLFESAPRPFVVFVPDARFTIVAVSDAYLRVTMTRREEITGRGLFEVFPANPEHPGADGVQVLRGQLERVVASRSADTIEVQRYDIPRPGGGFDERYWRLHSIPAFSTAGELLYIIHHVEDVSEFVRLQREGVALRHVERALRESREWFATVLNSIGDGVIAADLAGRILFLNPVAAALTGWTQDEAEGQAVAAVFHLIDRERGETVDDPLAQAARLQQPSLLPPGTRLRTRDGGIVPIDDTAAPILDAQGSVIGSVVVFRDTRERARLEGERADALQALSQANEALERRVRERTAELQALASRLQDEVDERTRFERALRSAKEDSERANRAKSEFLSRMSHELRTPLNAILGFSQILHLMGPLNDTQQGAVRHVTQGGKHLLNLINEVLDITRIEAGRLDLSPEPVRVRDMFLEVTDLVRPLAEEQGVSLEVDVVSLTEVCVRADAQRLKQVLLNLVSNGIKYSGRGATVVMTCAADRADRVDLVVRDNGTGIPAEKHDRLFVPFDRLGAESSDIQGTGLGLALSQRLVSAMGGTLELDPAATSGTTFRVDLPAAYEPTRPEAEPAPLPTAHEEGRPEQTVLYVEDNLVNLELVETILRYRPHVRLLPVMQGSLTIDLARQHRPDLILLDLHLPDVLGDEVLERLQADPSTCSIPIVMLSADASPRQIERLLAGGARGYLTKPLDVAQFLELVDRLLDGASSAD
jgi:PAS domain S-box-containing protein